MTTRTTTIKCSRCGGAGRSEAWRATGYECFDCGGRGVVEATARAAEKARLTEEQAALGRLGVEFHYAIEGALDNDSVLAPAAVRIAGLIRAEMAAGLTRSAVHSLVRRWRRTDLSGVYGPRGRDLPGELADAVCDAGRREAA